ncbi:UPF0149 family protein [Psychrobium sp. 1_MG-2023]|uniref:UPF0149 family protein n=1 Tax=Psychrobium sp. 1_MG-2023 TaxID=3062624 RepID=UPI000C331082|nr:UPF0149 family protein [Psychrobium sp. 1_MG-2023]MDP2562126.1 UPF0149 family protein [Psychrobium sp. 1_MG-2023]PKF57197.1 YecA family protein [Alteromonadales bacterium alter-6D02]
MTQISWQQLNKNLSMAELGATASESHGIICGLICGGVNLEDGSWYGGFNDLMNDGLALPVDLKQSLQQLFAQACNEFLSGDYQVKLLLPDDGQPLAERAQALAQWTESFMAGFAIGNESGKKLSKEIKEALQDLSQISQIDTQISDDEESEQFFEQVAEYVRMTSMVCFAELGQQPKPEKNDKKIH